MKKPKPNQKQNLNIVFYSALEQVYKYYLLEYPQAWLL